MAGLAATSLVFAQVSNFPVTTPSSDIPEFIFQLPLPPLSEQTIGPSVRESVFYDRNVVDQGTCDLPESRCNFSIQRIDSEYGGLLLSWLCDIFSVTATFPGAEEVLQHDCDITLDGEFLMKVSGSGATVLPFESGVYQMANLYCKATITVRPDTITITPSTSGPTVQAGTLHFENNHLRSGQMPKYTVNAPGRERVSIRVSSSRFIGESCLTPPFRVNIYDNNFKYSISRTPVFSPPNGPIDGIIGGWSWVFPDIIIEGGSSHTFEARFMTNCTAGAIESSANIEDVVMEVTRTSIQ